MQDVSVVHIVLIKQIFPSINRRTGRAGNHGYAYTFITPPQVRYAGDIIKALELSGSVVPPELNQLWTEYKTQQEAVSNFLYTSFCLLEQVRECE